MQATGISPLDLAVVGILLVSAFFAFLRGFTKEVLSLLGWAGAAVATIILFEPLRPLARSYIHPNLLADGATGVAIFLITLFILSFIGHAISARVRDSAIGALDRSLGFLYGLVRGAVVVCLAYMLATWIWPPRELPDWFTHARTQPLLEQGSQLLLTVLPANARALEGFTNPPAAQPSSSDAPAETGYKRDERRSLDTLIRSKQDQ